MHFYSLNRNVRLPPDQYFEYDDTTGYAYQDPIRGAVPFYWWHSSRFNDLCILPQHDWPHSGNLGYVNGGIVFFAHITPLANLRKLRHFVSKKTLENFYTPWNAEAEMLLASNEWFEKPNDCYVPREHAAGTQVLHRWRSTSGPWCVSLIRHDGTVAHQFEVNQASEFHAEVEARPTFEQYNREAQPEHRAYEMRLVGGKCEFEPALGAVRLRASSKSS